MAIELTKLSPTHIWIHDGNTDILEIDTTNGVNVTGGLKLAGETVAPSAAELSLLDGLTAGTVTASKALVVDSSSGISGLGLTYASLTLGSAPATTRLIRSELTLTPSTTDLDMSTNGGSLVAIRGCTTLTSGKSVSDGYLYGVQGKFVGDGATIAVGSQHVAAVLAQMSGSSMITTSGHIAPLVVSGQNLPTSTYINGIYVESGGGTINSILQANCKATFAFDLNNFESCGIISTPAGSVAAGNLRAIKVQLDGATYYILASASLNAS